MALSVHYPFSRTLYGYTYTYTPLKFDFKSKFRVQRRYLYTQKLDQKCERLGLIWKVFDGGFSEAAILGFSHNKTYEQ